MESYQYIKNIVFSITVRLIEMNFLMKAPYDKSAKINTNCFDHMSKMADIHIYGKTPLYIYLKNQKADDLVTWYIASLL